MMPITDQERAANRTEDAPAVASDRIWWWAAAIAALAAAAVYLARFPSPLSNIDDYNVRPFASGYFQALAHLVRADVANGRARPLYWVFEGAIGAMTGSSGTVLHVGRAAFLVLAVVLQVLVGRRLGAGPVTSAALALAANWSFPGIGAWVRGGPAEAFAQPLALACTWAALGARGRRGILAAAGLGLAAAFTKETYGVWTAAVLIGVTAAALAERPRGSWKWALAGAAVQLAPAALALGLAPAFEQTYAKSVLVDLAATPAVAAATFARNNLVTAGLGLAGLAAIAAARARDRSAGWRWPREDVVVVAAVVAVAAQTFLLGFLELRYELPLATVLLVAAARGAAVFAPLRARRVAVAAGLATAVVLGAFGIRVFYAARADDARCRADARMRDLLAGALRGAGEVRIAWPANDVETAIGALAHLRVEGIEGRVEMAPCGAPARAIAGASGRVFAAYAGPTTDAAPIVVSSQCGARVAPVERFCLLNLPGALELPSLACDAMPELAGPPP